MGKKRSLTGKAAGMPTGKVPGGSQNNMKKPVSKYVLIVLAAVVAVAVIIGIIAASAGQDYVAMINNEKISRGQYNYYLFIQKANMLQKAMQLDKTVDEATFWNTKIGGENAIDIAKKNALEGMREMKIQLSKAKEAGMKLTTEEERFIDDYIKSQIIDNEELGAGSRTRANTKLKEIYGITVDEMEKFQKEVFLVQNFAASEIEKINVDEAGIEKFYNENKELYKESAMRQDGAEAVWARHILIKADKANATEEQIAEAKKKAEDILAKVKAGEDFGKLAKEYSEDNEQNKNNGGSYVFSKGVMVSEFEEKAFSMEPGPSNAEIVQTDYGFHVLMVEEKYAEGEPVSLRCAKEYYEYGISFVKSQKYNQMLQEWKKDPKYALVTNQKVYDSIKG